MKRSTYLVFGQPMIEEPEIEEVVSSLRSAWLGTGPKVAEFERRVALYKGAPHAVAVNSCTAGIHLACLILGLGPGDEVIVPALTFVATVNAVIHAGATPILVDVEPDSFNIDPQSIRKAITSRTKAIIPVHFAGRACKMDQIMQIAREHNLRVIEDCAHAIETEFYGQKVGNIGDCGVLSFYSTKNVVTGEGGMLLTADAQIASAAKSLALHGLSKDAWKRFSDGGYVHYDVVAIGYKYNMMDLQAAIGLHQIERVDKYWERRREVWLQYDERLRGLPVRLPAPLDNSSRHGMHLYTILVDEKQAGISRDRMITELHKRNIGVGVHYRSIPSYTVYKDKFGWCVDSFPIAQLIGEQTISLPLSAKLTQEDVRDVVEAIVEILERVAS